MHRAVPRSAAAALLLALRCAGAAAAAIFDTAAALGAKASPPQPLADPAALVFCDAAARFTLLSPILVRAEYSESGAFEDRPSLAFVNRRLPVPAHSVANASSSAWCNISLSVSGMVVSYKKAAGSFTTHELLVHAKDGSLVWSSMADNEGPSKNLGGTVYDLKGQSGDLCGAEMEAQGICPAGSHIDLTCGGNTKTLGDGASYCTQGVLTSQPGGATVYDDSWNTVTEPESKGGWWASRQPAGREESVKQQDLYLFLHGTDHQAGLRSLASVSGRSAVPPRRWFGVWWSRWNKYTTQELRDMVDTYEANALPLDGINSHRP